MTVAPASTRRGDRGDPPWPRGGSLKICFVAPQAYNVLSGDRLARHIGGAEVQQALVARGLAERGHAVSFITLDHGQPDGGTLENIRVFKCYARQAGLPGVRFFHPRMTGLWKSMRRADADVYLQRTSDSLTGIVAAFCRRNRRAFVFSVGATADCDPRLPNCPARRERWLYRYGLRRADLVIAQTDWQRRQLRCHFDVDAVVVPSAAPDPGLVNGRTDETHARPRLLWVGRPARVKRVDRLIQLARVCGFADFDVIGVSEFDVRNGAGGLHDDVPTNVRLHGYLPHDRVGAFYESASALLCTSDTEGFPNAFLEAWSRGRPVVTTADPDDVVSRHGLGCVAHDTPGLADAVARVCRDAAWRDELGAECRRHYLDHHTPQRVLDRYEALLAAVAARPRVGERK